MSKPRYAFLEPARYARGWHIVLFSQELQVGEVKQLHYFEQDLVAYRGQSGQVAILDAHCPHLGANLGSGEGRVRGDNIACPFHGWTFNPQGQCVDIPYAKAIPEKAVNALRGWPVLEKNGFIALWYEQGGEAPENYLPDITEWGPQGWGDWVFYRSRIRARPCDIIENIVDSAHFSHVHGVWCNPPSVGIAGKRWPISTAPDLRPILALREQPLEPLDEVHFFSGQPPACVRMQA